MNSTNSAIKRFEEIHGPLDEMNQYEITLKICQLYDININHLPPIKIKELEYPEINN